MIHLKKYILTLVALLALTTQAWAEDPSESFTTTGDQVEFTGEHFIITGTENFEGLGFNVDNGRTITIASMNNEIITRVMLTFVDGYKYFGHGTADHGTIEYTYQDSREGVASIKYVNSTTLTIGCEISGFYCFTQICQITVYYTTAPAVTFVPVSGKTNEWTIKDGMPAGNVIVNAEYYQDAAFAMSTGTTPVALAPTANNSAKANTDDPLVTGGEVANIVEGTEALEAKQGTLMYYFDRDKATTKMTAAQLEALTANEWSDKVPTADGLHFDAATDVFVYYYIKGADDVAGLADGVKHTFSDSDPVCLTVSVQKEPTFKVELNAEGLTTAEAANWKAAKGSAIPAAFPLTGVKKDDNVTVTYSGSRKVIGLKAEKMGPTYKKWDKDQKKLVATEIPATATKVENANGLVTWSAGTYLVEGDVTIGGYIILSGDVELIIKDGAKLTAKVFYGDDIYSLSVYGQTNMSGELNVACSGDDAICNMKALNFHSCKVNACSPSEYHGGLKKIKEINVYGGSLDAENTSDSDGYGICEAPLNIYGGEVKAVSMGIEISKNYGIMDNGSSTVSVYGGKLWAECLINIAISSNVTLTKEDGFNGKIETSADGTSWTEYSGTGTPDAPYVRVGYSSAGAD